MLLKEAEKQYTAATEHLARDELPLKSRLKTAARQILRLQRLDLPQESLWTEHEGIKLTLTKEKKGRTGGNVAKTVDKMTDEERQKSALQIIDMTAKIKQTRQQHTRQIQRAE